MKDIYGFPRNSETLAVGGIAGASWKVFWSPPPINSSSAITVVSPVFPGRYFISPQTLGVPTASGGNYRRSAITPVIRFTGVGSGGSAVVTLVMSTGNVNQNVVDFDPGTGANIFGQGMIYMTDRTTLTVVTGLTSNDATDEAQARAISFPSYGGQDLTFSFANNPNQIFAFVMEYLDIPV